jgi:hypothetical protein
VRLEKPYNFETENKTSKLAELFDEQQRDVTDTTSPILDLGSERNESWGCGGSERLAHRHRG